MNISIWDLDYYHAKDKKNCFNPDAMKISSYHKQMGDKVNFVLTPDDIYRPFDKYYIIKENSKVPNPPMDLILSKKVIWLGKAYFLKQKWTMPDVMRAARPDYLLYPNHNTKLERAEHISLLTKDGKVLKHKQDYFNTFKNKKALVVDQKLWFAADDVVIEALTQLQGIKNLSFFEPIYINKIIQNKEIEDLFFKLKLHSSANFKWEIINFKNETNITTMARTMNSHLEFLNKVNTIFKNSFAGVVKVCLPVYNELWQNDKELFFELLKSWIIKAKEYKLQLNILYSHWKDNPYYFVLNELNDWSSSLSTFRKSWIEFITIKYGRVNELQNQIIYWSRPKEWNPVFRDLLRQGMQKDFLIKRWGDNSVSEMQIPWNIFLEEFKFGI